MKIVSLSSIIVVCTLLISCGTKGSLYIPEEKYPQTESSIIDLNNYYYQTKIT
ncbi:MAG: lipoprotein [Methylophilaceae bacterium]|nr:lipoprotein [Methylophilaceae bacterium]